MTTATAPAGTAWCEDWNKDDGRLFAAERSWRVGDIEVNVYGVRHRDGRITDHEVLVSAGANAPARHIRSLTPDQAGQLAEALREAADVAGALR
ncbi:hypothetical protein P3H80_01145 [Mycolicibacterium septicum]|uniref:hypothetical protein n=1 Tax=Mycolicibacterium septicum TaxID=98668 RepID=UPI0023E2807E|nr:hypothetical protein [Mycolicibacterium septicum]MDF3336004.1 hypothetical protein [Mycolicibacterium septicum]